MRAVLAKDDTWWFCFFYSVTFGGFVGLASFLNTFFKDQYFAANPQSGRGVRRLLRDAVRDGRLVSAAGRRLSGRPLGGVRHVTGTISWRGGVLLCGIATLPPIWFAALLLVVGMGLLGMGNGSVFQVVPQRFPKEIGVLTGIVGAAGGIGGFFLPNLLGLLKKATGSYGNGFLVFAAVALLAALLVRVVAWGWEKRATPAALYVPTAEPQGEPVLAQPTV